MYRSAFVALILMASIACGGEPTKLHFLSLKEINATNIKYNLGNDSIIDCSNRIITEDWDLSGQHINSTILIVNSTFLGKVNLENTVFYGLVDFNKTTFKEDINLWGAQFLNNVSFCDAHFENSANFAYTYFLKTGDFENANFSKFADFSEAIFNDTANFGYSHFNGANFNFAKFSNDAVFSYTTFSENTESKYTGMEDIIFKNAFFDNSKFEDVVSFHNSQFQEIANFEESEFRKDAFFNPAQFYGTTDFFKAHFLGDVDFSSSKFISITEFKSVNFDEDAVFWGVQLAKDNFTLNGARFSRFIARWDDIKDGLAFNDIIYSSLVKNFKDLGRTDDANNCYYDYRIKKQKNGLLDTTIDGLSWISCGYGVRPIFTILWCIGLIILFGGIFWDGKGIERSMTVEISEPVSLCDRSQILCLIRSRVKSFSILHRIWNRINDSSNLRLMKNWIQSSYLRQCLYFSVTIFVTGKSEDFSPVGSYRHLATLERISGWFFFALFVGVMTRTIVG